MKPTETPPEFTDADAASFGRYFIDMVWASAAASEHIEEAGPMNLVPRTKLADAYIRVWREQQDEIVLLRATIDRLEAQLRGRTDAP